MLGPFATTMLVPERLARGINSHVNKSSLGLRLKYRIIPSTTLPSRGSSNPRALSNKLQFLDAPMSSWVRNEILRSHDYECVENELELEMLKGQQQGVTIMGLVRQRSFKDGSIGYIKDDRYKLGDLSNYNLGSSNDNKLDLLRNTISKIDRKITAANNRIKENHRLIAQEQHLIEHAKSIAQFTFDQIDVSVDDEKLDSLEQQRNEILSSPELAQLNQRVNERQQHYVELDTKFQKYSDRAVQLASKISAVKTDISVLEIELSGRIQVDDNIQNELGTRIKAITRRITRRNIDNVTDTIFQELDETIAACYQTMAQSNRLITRILADYIAKWPVEKAELQADSTFAGEAINRLMILRGERLGEFEGKFLDLMNENSVKSLGALSTSLRRARGDIETRLSPVNESLSRSEFNTGRWLRVEVRDNRNADAQKFINDLTAATSGAMAATRDRNLFGT
jgi:uncharacterized protein YPO0396